MLLSWTLSLALLGLSGATLLVGALLLALAAWIGSRPEPSVDRQPIAVRVEAG